MTCRRAQQSSTASGTTPGVACCCPVAWRGLASVQLVERVTGCSLHRFPRTPRPRAAGMRRQRVLEAALEKYRPPALAIVAPELKVVTPAAPCPRQRRLGSRAGEFRGKTHVEQGGRHSQTDVSLRAPLIDRQRRPPPRTPRIPNTVNAKLVGSGTVGMF